MKHISVNDICASPHNPREWQPTPAVVVRRAPVGFELLTGHQRVAVAQEAGVRFPAVVMDTGENVWIEPDGSVTTHEQHDAADRTVREPRGRAPSPH